MSEQALNGLLSLGIGSILTLIVFVAAMLIAKLIEKIADWFNLWLK